VASATPPYSTFASMTGLTPSWCIVGYFHALLKENDFGVGSRYEGRGDWARIDTCI
jgi:hypothetical protein